jgi:O-antigen/teichoic acid export membrane protein
MYKDYITVRNITAIAAVLSQATAVGLSLLFIERYHGLGLVGVWGVLTSLISVIYLSEFGLGQSLIKFMQVALNSDCPRRREVMRYFIGANVFTVGIFLGFVCVGIWLVPLIVSKWVATEFHGITLEVLPLLAFSTLFALLARLAQSALIGFEHFLASQIWVVLSNIIFSIACLFLIPSLGLEGAGVAHLLMSTTLAFGCIATFICVAIINTEKIAWKSLRQWSLEKTLKEMLPISGKIQLIQILQIFTEVGPRGALAWVGGADAAGCYEFAYRFVMFSREILARPLVYLSGKFSQEFHASDIVPLTSLIESLRGSAYLAMLMLFSVVPLADAVGWVWLGEDPGDFAVYCQIIVLGWGFSLFSAPGYHLGIATGNVSPILWGLSIRLATNLAFVILALLLQGPFFILIGMSFGIFLGQSIMLLVTLRKKEASLCRIFDKGHFSLCVGGLVVSLAILILDADVKAFWLPVPRLAMTSILIFCAGLAASWFALKALRKT